MKTINRILFILLGFICVFLGALGMFLPILPTVPFLLLALACFAQSSRYFHEWLYHHRLFGPPLQQWQQYRVIPVRAKVVSITSMVASAIYVVFYTQSPVYMIVLMLAVMAYGAHFILTKPSHRKHEKECNDKG